MANIRRSSKRSPRSGVVPVETRPEDHPITRPSGTLTLIAPAESPVQPGEPLSSQGRSVVEYFAPEVPAPSQTPPQEPKPEAFAPVPQQPAVPEAPVQPIIQPTIAERIAATPPVSEPQRQVPETPIPEPTAPATPVAPAGGDIPAQPLLFEVAWEVCWQLGGIYTVLRSKAPAMSRLYDDRYHLIGPYNADTAAVEVEYAQPTGPVAIAIEKLRSMGITVHYGFWLITGRPRVILLDFGAAMGRLGEIKYFLWKDHGVNIPDQDGETNNVAVFGHLVSLFFQQLCAAEGCKLPVLAHFHEWMGGVGCMRIKHMNLPVATVFTTHATLVGRYLATDNPDLYQKLPYINPDHAAGHYAIYHRYSIERGAAHSADIFTTVSDITGIEAEQLLKRKPEVVTPNGLNIRKFAALHEFQNLHKEYKEVIHQFVAGHFFPSYHFDLDRTIYLFTSGRYEYTNKGFNLFIESLARLNHWLKSGNIPITVVAFIITRAQTKNINVDVLRSQAMFDELKSMCEHTTEEMGQNLLHSVSQGKLPERGELLSEEAVVRLKRGMHAWRTWRQPSIVTHDLVDDAGDPVLNQIRACQLFNAKHDAVKIVFHPDFVTATSPLIGLDYDQFVRGCHMGVFPSYYEPWGYTPMECVASGVPAVTSDLAGFGSYVLKNIQDPNSRGLCVIGRRYASWDQSAHQLTEALFNFCLKDRRARIEMRNRIERLSEYFDWSNLVVHYTEAHRLALQRRAAAMAAV